MSVTVKPSPPVKPKIKKGVKQLRARELSAMLNRAPHYCDVYIQFGDRTESPVGILEKVNGNKHLAFRSANDHPVLLKMPINVFNLADELNDEKVEIRQRVIWAHDSRTNELYRITGLDIQGTRAIIRSVK